jgi:hypothetical protein
MTTSRLAIVGAIAFNIPTIFAAAALPASAVAIAAVGLAVIGAGLGTVTGWAITSQIDAAVAQVRPAPVAERLAA